MKPYKILIWGCGRDYSKNINAIKYQELLGTIKVVGVTGKEELYSRLDGYQVFRIADIKGRVFDYVLAASEIYFKDIFKDAVALGIDGNKILSIRIFQLPQLDFREYINLLNSKISIIANNCWGGRTYHSLGMPFLSPFINIFIHDKEYLMLLNKLKYYINCELRFERWGYDTGLKMNYPICILDDIELFCIHYSSFEEVERKWHERCLRINWDNLFVMFFTESELLLATFEDLQFDKKVCFIPFESQTGSGCTLSFFPENRSLSQIVNGLASSIYHNYDVVRLLLEGKPNCARIQ